MTQKLLVTSIESHAKKVSIIVEPGAFQAWREGKNPPSIFGKRAAPSSASPRKSARLDDDELVVLSDDDA